MQAEIAELREAVEGLQQEVVELKSQKGTGKEVEEMQKKLTEIEDSIHGLEQAVLELKGNKTPDVDPSRPGSKTEKDIADMKRQISELQKSVEDIHNEQKKDKQFEAIMRGLADLQRDVNELKGNKGQQTDENLLKRISELEKKVEDLQQREDDKSRKGISFTARGLQSSGQTIIFQDVLNNDGNGYNPADGVFTAPVSGKYLFALTMTTWGRTYAIISLMKNGSHEIGRVEPDKNHTSGNDYDTAAVTSIADLNQNDKISVKCIGGGSGSFGGSNARNLSTFSAVRI